jgi:glycosyltransferase involved in cell wall biosynthesis
MDIKSFRATIIEPGGRGGVFQHAIALASHLANQGVSVSIHTANDLEISHIQLVKICRCFRWNARDAKFGKKSQFLFSFLFFTIPHLIWSSRNSIVNIQGLFRYNLYLVYFCLLKAVGRKVIFTPHNLFIRYKSTPVRRIALNFTLQKSDAVTVFNKRDKALGIMMNSNSYQVPLLQYIPTISSEKEVWWKTKLMTQKPKLMLMGQIRKDKGVLEAIKIAYELNGRYELFIIGEDKGTLSEGEKLAKELQVKVNWIAEYLPLDDFVACLIQADLLIFPYEIASQSGVMSIANSLGVPSLAFPVGGLVEYATYLAKECTVMSMTDAINSIASRGYIFREPISSASETWLQVFEGLRQS